MILAAALAVGCAEGGRVVAKKIESRNELIGGPGALGDVGDFLLANDQVRVIIQNAGFSRGFGLYGGALIDADLQRPSLSGDSSGGRGFDNFSELFPAFFLRAMRPAEDGIRTVDNEDGSSSIVVSGRAADFLFMITKVNDVVTGERDALLLKNEYKLRPGKRYVEITTTITNQSDETLPLPGDGVDALTGGVEFALPLGDVLLFGAGNKVFSPGAGFDLRFTLEALYKDAPPLPALPGLVTPFIASRGHNVSYGFSSGVTDPELSFVKRANYADARPDDLLIPFLFSAFTGAFYAAAPPTLRSRESVSFTKYFIVGNGDVASVRDVVHELRGDATGGFAGVVRDAITRRPVAGVDVITFDARGRPYSQHTTDREGGFRGRYEPGAYTYRVVGSGRYPTAPVDFEVVEAKTTSVEVDFAQPGWVSFRVRDQDQRAIPAKCSVVGRYASIAKGFAGREFLYDLRLGESVRPIDLIEDTMDPKTREYLEEVVFVGLQPVVEAVRPGRWRVVCSRGIEYDLFEQEITVESGRQVSIDARLNHVVKTPGWISADYHLHSINSVDSFMSLDRRVLSVAAEGVDLALASDHNFISDFSPSIASQGLQDWVQAMVGLEMTTLEIGHFNGFPLRYDAGPITKGAFEWSGRPPAEIFEDLRGLGAYGPDDTIIQVNHPRDTILGYFNDYNWNPETGQPEDSTSLILAPEGPEFGKEHFTLDFEAIEIFNGKRFEMLRTYRVPEKLPPGKLPSVVPPAGAILRDDTGKIAFPGAMDDWFALLDLGHRFTATGNSDSHDVEDEAGYPRTYSPVSNDLAGKIDELEIVAAMKSQQAVATNGPFIDLRVGGKGLGELADGSSGQVEVDVKVLAAPWVKLSRVNVLLGGEVVKSFEGDNASLAELKATIPVTKDGWLLVEAMGTESMWPVVTPLEVPSLQVSDAVGGIASAFNIDLNPYGALVPERVSITYPYGFTNPVWIDGDGDGKFTPSPRGRSSLLAGDAKAKGHPEKQLPALFKLFSMFKDQCGE